MIGSTVKKVILVSSGNRVDSENIPLGLMCLATAMRHTHGIETTIKDLPVESRDRIDVQVATYWRNTDFQNVLFVGFATVCGTITRTLSLAYELRRHYPSIPIVFGGPDASSHPQALLETYSFIDCIVVGEAEGVLTTLLHAISTGEYVSHPGLCFRDALEIGCQGSAPTVDLANIQPVDYSVYPPGHKDECVALDVGRGCPFACTFCSTKDFFRRNYRMKPTQRIVEEIQTILKNPYAQRIEFVHDMFTVNRKLVVELCQQIIASNMFFEWTCSSRTDRVDAEILKLMYQAGCRHIYFGIDTGSVRLQKAIRKNLDLEDAEQTLETALNFGFSVTAAVLIGFPNEEERDLVDTLDFVVRWGARENPNIITQVHLVTPMAETELAIEYKDSLLYDAYVGARMVVKNLTMWEERQVRCHPQLFQSFYYCRNPRIPRSVYKWIHNSLTSGQIRYADAARLAQWRGERPGWTLLQWAKNMPPYPIKYGLGFSGRIAQSAV